MSHVNFLGIPVEGDINRGSERKSQRPQSEFEPLVRALLDDPYIVEFGWRQYTPYFNDGDTCIFGAHGLWVRTQDQVAQSRQDNDDDEEDAERLGVAYSSHPSLGGGSWSTGNKYVGTRESQWQVCVALDKAIDGGEFDDVLLKLFGDHCKVTVKRDNIIVDEYSHD